MAMTLEDEDDQTVLTVQVTVQPVPANQRPLLFPWYVLARACACESPSVLCLQVKIAGAAVDEDFKVCLIRWASQLGIF